MQIELLGTGGYHPSEKRHTACLLLPELGLVLDAGSSSFRLPRRTRTRELDLFLTHAHLDHIMGLTFLLVPMINRLWDRVTVYATAETLEAVRKHLYAPRIFPVDPCFDSQVIADQGESTLAGGAVIRWQSLAGHPGGSMAYRVEQPRPGGGVASLAYVTDTSSDGSYLDFIRGVDLLIHECYFEDGREELAERTGHSCSSQVARVAAAAQVGRLIVTHLDPYNTVDDPVGLTGMRALFPHVEVAFDGMTVSC
ncbi:MBL fold metallo-hydrolase [Planctomicrobium sp. SH664]|uniref:MBL fold metallo-hydrolase n=1 Tax=Planctomicrobium sp. SH664 TaxID=3448125 RepID=UPI003F5C5C3F